MVENVDDAYLERQGEDSSGPLFKAVHWKYSNLRPAAPAWAPCPFAPDWEKGWVGAVHVENPVDPQPATRSPQPATQNPKPLKPPANPRLYEPSICLISWFFNICFSEFSTCAATAWVRARRCTGTAGTAMRGAPRGSSRWGCTS
jgi:hypothetical protein